MIFSYISMLVLIATFFGLMWLAISLKRRPILDTSATWNSKQDLAKYEERMAQLQEVILVADCVETPTENEAHEFLRALIDNFSEGVKYTFLVPKEYFELNGESINKKYSNIIRVSKSLFNSEPNDGLFNLLPRVNQTPGPDYPYLFYRFINDEGHTEVVAFRGEDLGRGISENYKRLEPEVARSFIRNIPELRGESVNSEYSDIQFTSETKVIKLDVAKPALNEIAKQQ